MNCLFVLHVALLYHWWKNTSLKIILLPNSVYFVSKIQLFLDLFSWNLFSLWLKKKKKIPCLYQWQHEHLDNESRECKQQVFLKLALDFFDLICREWYLSLVNIFIWLIKTYESQIFFRANILVTPDITVSPSS